MNLRKLKAAALLFATIFTTELFCAELPVAISSPDKSYTLEVAESNGVLKYSVEWNGIQVMAPSNLGLTLECGVQIAENAKLGSVTTKSNDTTWTPVYGEKNSYRDNYNESCVEFTTGDIKWALYLRAYNEGVAFRYEFRSPEKILIDSEQTQFVMDRETNVWVSQRAQSSIIKRTIVDLVPADTLERPLLAEMAKRCFVAIGEAKLVNFPRMKFITASGFKRVQALQASLESAGEGNATAVLEGSNNSTPWRYIMAGASAPEILQNNYLILNLNDENQIEDTSWIKPGKILREVTLTTNGAISCIDFAKRHNLQYIMFDAGWYGSEHSMKSDATTVTLDPKRSKGPLDMQYVLDYGKENGVGVVLYVNRRALEQQQDDLFPLFQKWGVAGIKYGFVNVGTQYWTNWLHESIKKSAQYKMLVDVHDEYRPTGWSRTYPNFLTQEGIRGDEESSPNDMVINTIFTRMIAGAADQTNCYHADRVEATMGSRTSQMAKMVCVYSPFQSIYWYDRPANSTLDAIGAAGVKSTIAENGETQFYAAVPTVWDETIIQEGYPGEFVRMARRSGNDWFVGALTGGSSRTFDIAFDFLKKGESYEATIYSDNVVDGEKVVEIRTISVDSNSKMEFKVASANGLAMIIREK